MKVLSDLGFAQTPLRNVTAKCPIVLETDRRQISGRISKVVDAYCGGFAIFVQEASLHPREQLVAIILIAALIADKLTVTVLNTYRGARSGIKNGVAKVSTVFVVVANTLAATSLQGQ